MMKKVILVLSLVLSGMVQAAGTVSFAKVQIIRVDASGIGIVYFDKDNLTPAGCVASDLSRAAMAFDTRTPGGAAILMTVTTAKTLDQRVWAKGTGACEIHGLVENWYIGNIRD